MLQVLNRSYGSWVSLSDPMSALLLTKRQEVLSGIYLCSLGVVFAFSVVNTALASKRKIHPVHGHSDKPVERRQWGNTMLCGLHTQIPLAEEQPLPAPISSITPSSPTQFLDPVNTPLPLLRTKTSKSWIKASDFLRGFCNHSWAKSATYASERYLRHSRTFISRIRSSANRIRYS
jgi:hypothetical protein